MATLSAALGRTRPEESAQRSRQRKTSLVGVAVLRTAVFQVPIAVNMQCMPVMCDIAKISISR